MTIFFWQVQRAKEAVSFPVHQQAKDTYYSYKIWVKCFFLHNICIIWDLETAVLSFYQNTDTLLTYDMMLTHRIIEMNEMVLYVWTIQLLCKIRS